MPWIIRPVVHEFPSNDCKDDHDRPVPPRRDRAAVTVDFVVLTAALTGARGCRDRRRGLRRRWPALPMECLGRIVVANTPIQTVTFASETAAVIDSDFSVRDWAIGSAVPRPANLSGFGDVLMLGSGRDWHSCRIGGACWLDKLGARSVSIMIWLGMTWMQVIPRQSLINGHGGQFLYCTNHGNITATDNVGRRVVTPSSINQSTMCMWPRYEPTGCRQSWPATAATTYTITVDNPGTNLTLGVALGGGRSYSGMNSMPLDDVSVVSN